MQRSRTTNNVITSIITKVILLVAGLLVPRVILTNYNSDVNGLISTVAQIFTYMSLLEAGISLAARNEFFKPLQDKEKNDINDIYTLATKTYRRISYLYLVFVVILAFVLPKVLATDIDYWTVFGVVLFEGLSNVCAFYFVNTFISFLNADGKAFTVNIIDCVTKILCYAAKISMAILGVNIAFIQLAYLIISILKILFLQIYKKRKYPWIKYNKNYNGKEKLNNRFVFLINEISWVVFSSTDVVIMGIFLSTAVTSVYSIYNMIFVALTSTVGAVYNSISYNLGNAYYKDIESCKKIYDLLNSMCLGTISMLMSVTYFLIIPFVKLYTEGVSDVNYICGYFPILFCTINLLSWSRMPANDLVGLTKYAKYIGILSIIEAISNIVFSIVFVYSIGLYGVLIATLISLPVKVLGLDIISDYKIFKRSGKRTILIFGFNYGAFGIFVLLSKIVKWEINSYFSFVLSGVVLTAVSAIVFGIGNYLLNKGEIDVLIKRKSTKKQ